jgi:hypothetical protein
MQRRGLIFSWSWGVGTTLVLSLMTFKQYYYLLPAIPGCARLLSPVLHQLLFGQISTPPRFLKPAMLIIVAAGAIVGWFFLRRFLADSWSGSVFLFASLMILIGIALLEFAIWSFFAGRRKYSFRAVGITAMAGFVLAWSTLGSRIGSADEELALARALRSQSTNPKMDVYWTSNIPDGRITFYGQQPILQIVDSFEFKASHPDLDMQELLTKAGFEASELLSQPDPVLLVFERERFNLFRSMFSKKGYIWFEIDRRPHGSDADDWLVVSNRPKPG